MSFSSTKEKMFVIEKKVVFIFCSFICVFVNSSIESLLAFVFSVSKSIEWLFVVLNLRKSEIVQTKKIKFLDKKIVIKSDVSNLCKTNNSNFSSLNKSCVEIIKIEKKKKRKEILSVSSFLWSTFCLIIVKVVKKKVWKKKKKKMFFEVFNQYRKNRSIFDESDANLI